MSVVKSVLMATRPNFLLLSVAVLTLAAALSLHILQQTSNAIPFNKTHLALLLLVFICAHAAVNLKNEIDDSRSGLDAITVKTPFSGGTGALLTSPQALKFAERLFAVLFVLLLLLGGYFTLQISFWLLPLGVLGLGLIYFYTTHITAMPWFCWFAAGFAFGPIMLFGAVMVLTQTLTLSLPVVLAGLLVFIWVNNLLLLNQLPDVFADRQVGRFNLWMRYGLKVRWMFFSSVYLSPLVIFGFAQSVQMSVLHWALLWVIPMGWLHLALAKWLNSVETTQVNDVMQQTRALSEENLAKLRPILAMNVIINLLLPLSLALMLLVSVMR
ncbi:hypothetical protein THMIRHAS_12000 [Thiosulfatimonas sediminis]|uniref:1,4-dihydroxy-2-naphthoate octaprenyltransferase n=1 Tax=Thiosulfatimonas sediminis TaxID=2675054 RepID=A0A6F8PUW8_9GAMM|nr:prenyltransferase [Thiosulfatimonas sediminis]BBP45827.1 hypothetical protein THMIRHAS_12000 [Thiosulfatimonas sediminis]